MASKVNVSKFFRINFSSDDLSINGIPLDEAKDKAIKLFKDKILINSNGKIDPEKDIDEVTYDEQRDTVISKRQFEKNLLIDIFKNVINIKKSIGNTNEVIYTIASINDSEDHKVFSGHDIKTIEESYEKIEGINVRVVELPELFEQLNLALNNDEKQECESDGKPVEKKKEPVKEEEK